MFWRVATFSQASPVEAILDKEHFTLEELLDEEEIIQECKTANTRLVSYLKQKQTIASLIRYLAEPPEDDVHYRYSSAACEIFCCELDEVFSTLLDDEALLTSLFSLLDRPAPLDSTLAGYFGRVVGSLLIKRPEKTHEYLQHHAELLPKLVAHIDSTSAVEVVLRMVGADEVTSSMAPANISDWLAETELMQLLLARLCAPLPANKHARLLQQAAQRNVAHIMVMLAGAAPSPLADQLTTQQYLRTMLDHASRPSSAVLRPILSVCIALLEPSRAAPGAMVTGGMAWGLMAQSILESQPDSAPPAPPPDTSAVRAAAAEITHYLDRFSQLLAEPGPTAVQLQPYGTLKPPLGRHRLTVVEFGKALLSTNLPVAISAVVSGDFVPMVMKLFQDFPFNNILHSYVVQILDSLLETLLPEDDRVEQREGESSHGPPRSNAMTRIASSIDVVVQEDVLSFLVDDCNLIDWIVSLKSFVPPSSSHFEALSATKPLQAAYQGHITELANKLLRVAEHNDGVKAALDLNKGWCDFVQDVLEKRNQVQNTEQWDVGRPPTDNTLGSSEGDDEEGSLKPLAQFLNVPLSADDNPLATSEPMQSFGRYKDDADEEDANSMESDDSVEEELQGPESHHIAGGESDSDSDSSDGAGSDVYPQALPSEPQTIEDEDEVELGDEASSPEPTPREDDPQEVDDEDGATATGQAAQLADSEAAWAAAAGQSTQRAQADAESLPVEFESLAVRKRHILGLEPSLEDLESVSKEAEFMSNSFWKIPLVDMGEEELP